MKKEEKWSKSISVEEKDGKILIVPCFHAAKRKKIGRHLKQSTDKFIAIDKDSGEKTCGIILKSGKIFLGEDVWRLSNPSDCCEYPYKRVSEIELDFQYNKVYTDAYWAGREEKNALSQYNA